MRLRSRKTLWNLTRLAICAAALWLVARGVTLTDCVTLRDGRVLRGWIVSEEAGRIVLSLGGGDLQAVRLQDVAADEDGAPRIAYGLRTVWGRSAKSMLLLSVAIFMPVGVLQGQRIRWLLQAQGIHVNLWDCIKLSFAGNFLNFAAPLGSTGGDVFKAYFVTLHTARKTEAVTTIALDRIIGLGTLVAIVALITTLSPRESRLAALRWHMLTIIMIGLASVAVYFSPLLRNHTFLRARLERLPGAEQLRRMDRAARVLASRRGIVIRSVAITALLQLLAVCAYFTVAAAVGMATSRKNFLEYYAYFSTGAVVQALPGPPQGLGTVELAYRYFFRQLGDPSQIVCMAITIRLIVLACAMPGALVAATGSYRPRFHDPDRPDAQVQFSSAQGSACDSSRLGQSRHATQPRSLISGP